MAYEIPDLLITLPAASTSLAQFTFVVVDSSGRAATAGDGVAVDGVLQNAPNVVGEAATIMVSGISKVVAPGSTVAVGDLVASSSVGRAVAAAAGDYAVGRVVFGSSGSTGRYLSVLLSPIGTT